MGSIATAQPPAASGYEVLFRFFNPIASGFEGALGQTTGGGAVLDAAGRLVQVRDALVSTFLAGPGSVPAGYGETSIVGDVTFSGGTHSVTAIMGAGNVVFAGGLIEIGGTYNVTGSTTVEKSPHDE